jgi:hypothetical protein
MRESPKAQDANEAKMLEMIEREMDNPQVTAIELAWLAGIWDGEGTISVRRNTPIKQLSPRCSMVNTNPMILERVCDILTRLGIRHYMREKGAGGFEGSVKQCWIISMDSLTSAAQFLQYVKPFLVGKQAQACLLARFVSSRLRRKQLTPLHLAPYSKEELHACTELYLINGNQRGTSETTREALVELERQQVMI